MEETAELALVPKEHEQRQTDDHSVDFFVPQSLNDIIEVVSLVPREHGQRHVVGFSSSSKFGKRTTVWIFLFPKVWKKLLEW